MRRLLIAGATLALMSGAAMAQVSIAPSVSAGNAAADNSGGPASGYSSTTLPGAINGTATITTGDLSQGHSDGSDSSSR
jgi:hypothetical protein